MVINDNEKTSRIFFCKFCDYKTSRLYNWERHVLTPKHKMVMHSARFTETKTTLEKNEKNQFDMSLSSQTGCSFSEQKMPKNEQKPKQRFFCDYCLFFHIWKLGFSHWEPIRIFISCNTRLLECLLTVNKHEYKTPNK